MLHHRTILRLVLGAVLLLSTGCDALLGPAEPVRQTAGPGWTLTEVTTGAATGLDLGITDDGTIYASYIHDGSRLRVSRLDGEAWTHLEGPAVSGPLTNEFTRLAVDPAGGGSVVYPDGTSLLVADFDVGLASPEDLAVVDATLRDGGTNRPATWTGTSSSAAYGSDGVLRIVARPSDQDRLWLFRRSTEGWSLGPVPGSDFVFGTSEILVSTGSVEHVLFAANNQGSYYWWRPGDGWASRLAIPDGQPYVIQIDGGGSSVLATRDRFSVRVAKEEYDVQNNRYFWSVRTVVEDEHLFWHTLDLVLDDQGLPGVLYVLGPLPREDYEVRFSRLTVSGWESSLVAGNLRLPEFNPFDVRMVRGQDGTIHVLLPAEGSTQTDGSSHRLVHLRRDPDEAP